MPINQEAVYEDSRQEIEEPEKEERLGLHERNTVQIEIMKEMLESGVIKTELEWAEIYGKAISDIIDNPQNAEIRKLIKEGDQDAKKYGEAADLIISLLMKPFIGKAA